MNKRSIEDIQDLKGKRVLMRVDFNVPMDKETGEITDETRIMGALPSIKYLYEHGAKVILCSHLGRPKGEFNMKFSLAPVAKRLGELVDTKVIMAKDVVGEDAKKCVAEMKDGEIVVLENVRFHNEETKRPGFLQGIGEPGGCICQRCLRYGAPCPCLYGGLRGLPAGLLRLPD